MEVPTQQQQLHVDDTVKQLLDQAQGAIHASNAGQALQCVIQALKLVRGDSAVLPTLRHAAEQYHAQRAAPIQEISQLLAQVSLHTEQQQQQQQWQHLQALHHQGEEAQPCQQQHPAPPGWQTLQQQQQQQCDSLVMQHQPGIQPASSLQQQQRHQQQQQQQKHFHQLDSAAILDETGRGALADAALADGSSWQCPQCGGVVPQQRQQAHLEAWCSQGSSRAGDDMIQ